jgi:predicted DNA-binding protein
MAEKLLEAVTIRMTIEDQQEIACVAAAYRMDKSEFIRAAIKKELESARSMYQALHSLYGSPRNSVDDGG